MPIITNVYCNSISNVTTPSPPSSKSQGAKEGFRPLCKRANRQQQQTHLPYSTKIIPYFDNNRNPPFPSREGQKKDSPDRRVLFISSKSSAVRRQRNRVESVFPVALPPEKLFSARECPALPGAGRAAIPSLCGAQRSGSAKSCISWMRYQDQRRRPTACSYAARRRRSPSDAWPGWSAWS